MKLFIVYFCSWKLFLQRYTNNVNSMEMGSFYCAKLIEKQFELKIKDN